MRAMRLAVQEDTNRSERCDGESPVHIGLNKQLIAQTLRRNITGAVRCPENLPAINQKMMAAERDYLFQRVRP